MLLESMAMEVYGNLTESFDMSREKTMANAVFLIFLESRITSITLLKGKEKVGRQKEKKEGWKRFVLLI